MTVPQAQFNVGDQVTITGQLGIGTVAASFYLPSTPDPAGYTFPHLIVYEHQYQPIDTSNKLNLPSGWCYSVGLDSWGTSDLFFAHEVDLQANP